MATAELSDSASTKEAKCKSLKGLDLYFQDWETRFVNDKDSATVLIPPCADIEKTSYRDIQESGIIGRDAERDFIETLLKFRIGGILVTGVKSKEFLKAFGAVHNSKFEIDALFLHGEYGAIIFECKAVTLNEKQPVQSHKNILKARDQLRDIKIALRGAYKIYNNVEFHCIRSVILVPNAMLDKEEKSDFERMNSISLWDKQDLQPESLLRTLFDVKANVAGSFSSQMESFKNFARKTAECRSLIFLSPKLNALAINDQIERHLHLKPPPGKPKTAKKALPGTSSSQKQNILLLYNIGDQAQPVYLNREQEDILQDPAYFRIISGLPGTGKTLLMLLKILQLATDEDFKQKIVVYSNSEGSAFEIQKFLALNLAEKDHFSKVKLNLTGEFDQFLSAELVSDGALFMDELIGYHELADVVEARKECSGITFLCVSGFTIPGYLSQSEMEQQLDQFDTSCIKYTFLSTVYRGTVNIIKSWKPIYESNFSLNIGHKIRGFEVEEYELGTFNELLEILTEGLNEFSVETPTTETNFSACAVIVDCDVVLDIIRKFLAAAGIPCGSVMEYVRQPTLTAIDQAEACLSMEWPIVFYIETGLYSMGAAENIRFIANSRAMVKLVTLRWDIMKVSEEFGKTCIERKVDLTTMKLYDYVEILLETQQRVCYGETEQEIIQLSFSESLVISILQYDYWPLELKRYPPFDCASFFDALQVISTDEHALFKIVCVRYRTFMNQVQAFENRETPDVNSIPKFLKRIYRQKSSEHIAKIWKTCIELREKLAQLSSALATVDDAAEMEKLRNEFSEDLKCLHNVAAVVIRLYVESMPMRIK